MMVQGYDSRFHIQLLGDGKETCASIHIQLSQEDVKHKPTQHTTGSIIVVDVLPHPIQ